MCGLVGAVSSILSAGEQDVFRLMFHFDIVRGEDASGVFIRGTKGNKKEMVIAKTVGLPYALYSRYPYLFSESGKVNSEVFKSVQMMLGHNRAKTIGENNASNAHPFHHGNIVGFHNGTCTGVSSLPEIPGGSFDKTDSERIFYALSTGMSLQAIVDKIHGPMALVWYDAEKKKLNMFRNKERSLYYYLNAGTLYYASESWMITLAAQKSKTASSIMSERIVELKEYQHVVFDVDGAVKLEGESSIEKKTFSMTTTHTTHGSRDSFRTPPDYIRNHKSSASNLEDPIPTMTSGFVDNSGITAAQFEELSKYGCCFCSQTVYWMDHVAKKINWVEKDSPLCPDCSKKMVNPQ